MIIIEMQMLKFLESVQAEESNNLLYREHCSDLVSFRVAFVAMIFLIASIVLIKLIRSEEICRLSITSLSELIKQSIKSDYAKRNLETLFNISIAFLE